MNEEFRKQIAEFTKQSLSGQNLTSIEKIYADTVPIAFFILQDKNNPVGVTLVNYKFPNSISESSRLIFLSNHGRLKI
jgi:hypothetical protein